MVRTRTEVMWRCCLKPAEPPFDFPGEGPEVPLSSAMKKFCLATLFACNLSNRGRSEVLDIVLVEHTTVPRQCKLLEDADGSRLCMNRPHRTI